MNISGKIEKRKAIAVDEASLKNLYDIVLQYSENVKFEGTTVSDSTNATIQFNDIDELLAYENNKWRRLLGLKIYGNVRSTQTIVVDIRENTLALSLMNYEKTFEFSYHVDSIESETILKRRVEEWFEKVKCNYWRIGKLSLFRVLIILFLIFSCLPLPSPKTDTVPQTNYIIMMMAAIGGFCVLVLIGVLANMVDKYVLKNLYPPVAFLWGDEIRRYEEWAKWRSQILWGIFVAPILGGVGNYLLSFLFNVLKSTVD